MNKETPTFPRAVLPGHVAIQPGAQFTKALRNHIRNFCRDFVADHLGTTTRDDEAFAELRRQVIGQFDIPDSLTSWLEILLVSCFWERHVASVPYPRRMLLIANSGLKNGCPNSQAGNDHEIDKHFEQAQRVALEKGILVESLSSSSNVLRHIVHNGTDALIGVGTPAELEPILRHSQLAGIPFLAVPLLADHDDWELDAEWLHELVNLPHDGPSHDCPRTYVHLMRAAARMFGEEFSRLCPASYESTLSTSNVTGSLFESDPIAATEFVSLEFLRRGGKQSRPFMLLAVYDALTGGKATKPNNSAAATSIPDSVKRTAMSIETFHKASLVHDDIQDEDDFRYGQPSIHKQYGIPLGINIGDYLIGLGYRLVSRDRHALGGDTAAEILDHLADAHQRLCAGQGAELAWRDCAEKRITPESALEIYSLKTAPAFEVAMVCGACLAGQSETYVAAFRSYAHHLGVAFQILNDLQDWITDPANKKNVGGDLLNGRPTVLWALATRHLPPTEAAELVSLSHSANLPDCERLSRAREYFLKADVFSKAEKLVREHQAQAERIAESFESADLRHLLRYIVGSVLARASTMPCRHDDVKA
ncbi:MAG: polyprenyl synthetase family protein [Pirellulaceae bacterium]|nr:polyprenyl synthetase family protein [Pirellulaceae bacterium]